MQAFIDPRFEVSADMELGTTDITLVNPKGSLRTHITVFKADEDKLMDGFFSINMHPGAEVVKSEFRAGHQARSGKYVIGLGDHHTAFVSQEQFEALYQSMTELREEQRQYRR